MEARILVVEDDRFIREVVATALRIEGYSVDVAADGLEAWQYLTTRTPRVMVLDLSLPHVDGLTLCRRVRAHPKLGELPILATSATASRLMIEAILSAGADDFLDKPFELGDLIERIGGLASLPQLPEADGAAPRPAERV